MVNVTLLLRPMPPPNESARLGNASTCTGRPASRLTFIAALRSILTPTTFARGPHALERCCQPAAGEAYEQG